MAKTETFRYPALLIHGVGVRCSIDFYRSKPRLAELCQRSKHGFTLSHKGTIFYINTTENPNVWFHLSIVIGDDLKDSAESLLAIQAMEKSWWLNEYLDLSLGHCIPEPKESWKTRRVWVPLGESARFVLKDSAWLLPGELSKADLDRLAGEYPEPVPGQFDRATSLEIKQFIKDQRAPDGRIRYPRSTLLQIMQMVGVENVKEDDLYSDDILDHRAIVKIIRKYNDSSFDALCQMMAEQDPDGSCEEICNRNIDGGDPECCPVKDFRDLVRLLKRAFPHQKQDPAYGGDY